MAISDPPDRRGRRVLLYPNDPIRTRESTSASAARGPRALGLPVGMIDGGPGLRRRFGVTAAACRAPAGV